MDGTADFLEIPVRDDVTEFTSLKRSEFVMRALSQMGVDIRQQEVADIGAGYGSLSIACARSGARQVTAYDVNADRLAEIDRRAKAANLEVGTEQMNLLHPWGRPPVADVGLMFGVVEYAGLWNERFTPSQLQQEVLRNAAAMIKSGGVLVLGTKNRAWPVFAARDVHTQQPFVNILPRRIADIFSRKFSGHPYRHHLHTPNGWSRLLLAAGFTEAQQFVPYFSYQVPLHVSRRPSLADLRSLSSQGISKEDRLPVLGRTPKIKAGAMIAGHLLGMPMSQSTIIVARK